MAYFYDLYDEETQENLSQQDYKHAKDHLTGLLEDIYETGNLDDLEFHLEEICSVFGLKLPKKDPILSKTQTSQAKQTDAMLKEWVGLTQTYASMLCNK